MQRAAFYPPDTILVPAASDQPIVPGHLYVVEGTSDEFRADLETEVALWTRIVRERRIAL